MSTAKAGRAQPLLALGITAVAALVTWLTRDPADALAVLAVGLPVGLLLAVALPPWLTRRAGRRIGVTSMDLDAVEKWNHVRSLVLDPFRSLTTGHLVVTEVQPVDPEHEGNLRWFAGALAHSYDDPVGRAVAKLAGRGRITNVATEPGLGIRGTVDRHPVRVGHPQWIGMDDRAVSPIGTTVAVDVDQRPLGRITVADEVRRDAARQLDRLRRAGFTPILAAARSVEETERLAKLSSSPTWHAETDPHQLAGDLAIGGEPVGLVQGLADDTAALLIVGPDADARGSGEPIYLATCAIDTVVDALTLAARAHQIRRRSIILAWLLYLLPLPAAALGLLTPVVALAMGAVTWAVVGLVAAAGFVGLDAATEPDPA